MTDAPPLEYNPAGNAERCMILLHGLGASGDDLFPLADSIGGGQLRVVCPHAPLRAVTLCPGMPMRAWYDIAGTDLSDRQDRSGAEESAAAIEQLIAAEKARGFSAAQIILAGFSQGAAMALHVGLRHHEALGGIAALSGYLLFAEQLGDEGGNHTTPIFQGHGGLDMVVLPQWAHLTRDILQANKYALSYREYSAMPHSIIPEEISDLNNWLETLPT